MANPTALEFVSKWDYHNANESLVKKFEEQADDFPRGHEWQDEDLKAALKHFRNVTCSSDFPVYDTGPANFALTVLDWLVKRTNQEETYYDDYIELVLSCVGAGPSLAQIEIMDKAVYRGGLQKYFRDMSGDKLVKFLRGLKKKFVNNETMPKEYCSKLCSVLKTKIIQSFQSSQCQEHRGEFVGLMMFYQNLVPDSDEHMAQLYYTNLTSAIERLLSREKWKDLEKDVSDPSTLLLREQTKAFGNVIAKSKNFPAYEKQPDIFRENEGYFTTYLDDVMQLFYIVAKHPFSVDHETLTDPHSSFFSRLDQDKKKLVTNKPDVFEKYAPKITNLILDIPSSSSLGKLIGNIQDSFLIPLSGGDPKHVKLWAKYLAALVTHPDTRYVEKCHRFMRDQKKVLRWKENVDGASLILSNIGAVKLLKKPEEEGRGRSRMDHLDPDRVGRAQGDVVEELLKQLKFYKVIGKVQKQILSMLQQYIEVGDSNTFSVAKECAEFIDIKDDLSMALPLINTFEKQFKREDYPWDHWAVLGITLDLLTKVIQAHKEAEQFSPYIDKFVSIFQTAMNRDYWNYESDSKNVFGYVLVGPLLVLGALYRTTKNHDDLKPLLGGMVKLLTCEDEDIASSIGNTFMIIGMANAALFAPHLKEILDALFQTENTTLLSVVQAGYPLNPQPVDDEFEKVFDFLESVEANSKMNVLTLLKEIAAHSPQKFTKDKVDTLCGEYLDNQFTEGLTFQVLQAISQNSPELLEEHVDLLFNRMKTISGAALIPPILLNIGHKNKKFQKPVFDKLINYIKTSTADYTYLTSPLNVIRVLGSEDREMLKPHKELFESLGEKHAQLKDMCKMLVDIIEGRSVEDITDKIEQQQEGLEQLDTRVTNTENDVTVLNKEMDKQGQNIGQLRQDVDKQEERIDELEEVVDDTVVKVEEIDNKTLSNAPAWSRDVSKLLNPEAEHDWRLLAQRLGYSPEDIRGWATQHDPCMSLLSEWFATHKTSEATKAVLKTLEEMNRLDAAEIVGRAMQAVENIVQDEPPEYDTPPPVFISYQWGHQPEVRLLRKHLEMAGFASWMDIGQMGGGDKLYAKIDEGIRSAQAVICCVTEKYAKSPNCNREVNLAVNLGKPIIPLLLENVSWPPPGAMGPIFGEYLYIRFFQRGPEEDTKDERVWPALSFQELLMQLSYMKLIPDKSKITIPYNDWWLPPEEVIVVKKRANADKSGSANTSTEEKDEGINPEVFISYQWGIQPQVKSLYKRMSGLGYHCWMDIHQMGGGDSLYDKIDRGVRGCRVVLSCVTEKYSKSANCRREVSLADALKKPIIPLLLEDTKWPPSGPMSMVFTQLLYIDLKDAKTQTSWTGQKFDELLQKIKSYIPDDQEKAVENVSGHEKPDTAPKPAAEIPQSQEIKPVIRKEPTEVEAVPHSERPMSSTSRKSAARPYTPPKKQKKSKSCMIL